MYRFFDAVFIDHIDHLNSNTQRYVVGRDIADQFLESEDDRLSKSLGIPELAKTRYHTQDVDDFVTRVFPEELESLCDGGVPVTIFCDDEAYIKLFCFWVRHLFPTLTPTALRELAFLLFLNRERSEEAFSWGKSTSTANYINRCIAQTPRSEVVFDFLKHHYEHLPVEYRLVGYMAGGDDPTLPERLRMRLHHALDDQLETQRSKLGYLYFSPHIKKMLGSRPTADLTMSSPLKQLNEFKVISHPFNPNEVFSTTESIAEFKSDYQHDLRKVLNTLNDNRYIETNVTEMSVPVELLELSDSEIIDGYIEAYTRLDRLTLIVPPVESRMFTTNLVFWAINQRENGTPVSVSWTA